MASDVTDQTDLVKQIATELLDLMGTSKTIQVDYDKENDSYVVGIEGGEEAGLLIGKKGETLLSIQTILGLIYKVKTGEWKRIMVNVGDYKEKEEDYLKNLAKSAAERVEQGGSPQNLYNLKSWQRRVIHLFLQENYPDIVSESAGEGEERYLIIRAK